MELGHAHDYLSQHTTVSLVHVWHYTGQVENTRESIWESEQLKPKLRSS